MFRLATCAPAGARQAFYFTGNNAPTIWVGDTGGAGVAPASVLYSDFAGGVVGIDESDGELYWATARSTSVFMGAADGTGPITTLYEGDFHNLRGLAVSHVPEPGSGWLLLSAVVVGWLRIPGRR